MTRGRGTTEPPSSRRVAGVATGNLADARLELTLVVPGNLADRLRHELSKRGRQLGAPMDYNCTRFDSRRESISRHGYELWLSTTSNGTRQALVHCKARGARPIPASVTDLFSADRACAPYPVTTQESSRVDRAIRARAVHPVERVTGRLTYYDKTSRQTVIREELNEAIRHDGIAANPHVNLRLSLRSGSAIGFYRMAQSLAARYSARVAPPDAVDQHVAPGRSFASRAHGCGQPNVMATATSQVAFRKLVHACVNDWLACEPAANDLNPDTIHRYRVALRRLRSLLSLFRSVTLGARREAITADLRGLMAVLSPARDLDVFREFMLSRPRIGPAAARLTAQEFAWLDDKRSHAYTKIADVLHSPRYRQLPLSLLRWADTGAWNSTPRTRRHRHRDVATHLQKEAHRRQARIVRAGRNLAEASDRERHQLRIRAKKLRHCLEFLIAVDEANAPARRRAALKASRDLQASLGALNDLGRQIELARQILARRAGRPRARSTTANEARVVDAMQRAGDRHVARAERAISALDRATR